MGLYTKIEERISKQFSIFQLMTVLGIGASNVRLARNLLKQFHRQGYIKRISKNMYEKVESTDVAPQIESKSKKNLKKKEKRSSSKTKGKKSEEEPKQIPLTKLNRLGKKTEEKFNALGINSVNDLIKETPSDLAKLISGVSKDSIKEWIEEGKKLLK
ncbi:MAG: putative penicillin-binding protein 2 [Promethearchaeota archaeon]|nr:MAG: putative penicillin-binding protein 2 [Candidatus Lokiarchaeota archaeon]